MKSLEQSAKELEDSVEKLKTAINRSIQQSDFDKLDEILSIQKRIMPKLDKIVSNNKNDN